MVDMMSRMGCSYMRILFHDNCLKVRLYGEFCRRNTIVVLDARQSCEMLSKVNLDGKRHSKPNRNRAFE